MTDETSRGMGAGRPNPGAVLGAGRADRVPDPVRVAVVLYYIGTDSVGTARHGCSESKTAAQLAEEKFRQGWRSLVITDGRTGLARTLGQIHRVDGRRVWWGEK